MAVFVELKIQDNDKKLKWGGVNQKEAPLYNVTDLQNDLKSVGTYTSNIDGDFGAKTEKSLKLFQWACVNSDAYIKAGSRLKRSLNKNIYINGRLSKVVFDELLDWVKNKKVTTGDLVRVAFSDLPNVDASTGFKKTVSSKVFDGELVISKGAIDLLKDMDSKAKAKKVKIKVNQVFRSSGVKVNGAVVPPATKSQHLVGHAIDCNIVDGTNWNNSATFKKGQETQNAKDLIGDLKKIGYRWGGDFGDVDTPHFDSQLAAISFSYDAKFYFNQRMISEMQPIAKETVNVA